MESQFDLVIESGKGFKEYWRDLWRYRELFFFLAWKDILVRYKQTIAGVAWGVIRPLLIMVVFTLIFGKMAQFPSDGNVPYPILVFAALLPWQFFANALSECSNSLVANAGMISKVYFPRLIVPASKLISSLVDFLISFVILAGLMVWFKFVPSWRIVTLPFFLTLSMMVILGLGNWLAALNVKYRDMHFIVPFIVQFGLYISPVGFSSNVVPANLRLIYSLNPMVGIIDGFRWAILGEGAQIYLPGLLLSVFFSIGIFFFGIFFFRKMERAFADVI